MAQRPRDLATKPKGASPLHRKRHRSKKRRLCHGKLAWLERSLDLEGYPN